MSGDVSFFTQDFWMNSLAIGHPLVYHFQANGERSFKKVPENDDTFVSTCYNAIVLLLIIDIVGTAMEHYGHG